MKIRRPMLALCVLVVLGRPSPSFASVIWSWSFDPTEYVVSTADPVVITAALSNSSLSTEPITERGGGSFTGDLQKTYNFTPGPDGQYAGLNVAPGETFPFIIGTLTPIGGSVPPGLYPFCCEAHLAFGSATEMAFLPPENTFSVRAIPEPPAVALFALGAALAGGRRRYWSAGGRARS